MQIVAVTNIKGGVGKTTTAVNLAYLAARDGLPTLLWDLDPQGAATWLLQGVPGEHGTARRLVHGKRELNELVVPSAYPNLDLLPADFSYRNFDLHLQERKRPTERLLKMSAALGDRYAYLFLDCPPGISLLTENVLRATDAVVVPMLPSPLSVRMLATLQEFAAREGWLDLVLLPFFSMVDRRRSLHVDVIGSTRARFPFTLATELPYWSEIERMSVRRAPLPAYAPRGEASLLYETLLGEIAARLAGVQLRREPPGAAVAGEMPAPSPGYPPRGGSEASDAPRA